MKRKSSTTMPIPLQIIRPGQGRGEDADRSCSNRELQIVDPASSFSNSDFKLPSDWVVEERRRRKSAFNPARVDKYYHEPGTGKIFRSLTSVKKYLIEEPGNFLTEEPNNGKNMQIVVHTTERISHFRNTSSFELPDGWIVEEKPRKNIHYKGVIDRYYIEPGTGNRFRSLRAVERRLKASQECAATGQETLESGNQLMRTFSKDSHSLEIIPEHPVDAKRAEAASKTLEPENPSTSLKDSRSGNKHKPCEGVTDPLLDFSSTPPKIKWVFNGSRGNVWSPSASGSLVQESVKQKWSEAFASYIQERGTFFFFL
ncbi:methyl-CpG-binding domain-containing protein 7 isoform X2 [Carica papaya]|uniref:methyl-CpG-binding domain-containing protein 7 isoform X2 n=1 Tax=Carica papaya TaxID=3649 RepID=UPI000B8C71AB|nr:methyl-CpG-binding domain-containing protein 7 isoform X2 [Carica papaya]